MNYEVGIFFRYSIRETKVRPGWLLRPPRPIGLPLQVMGTKAKTYKFLSGTQFSIPSKTLLNDFMNKRDVNSTWCWALFSFLSLLYTTHARCRPLNDSEKAQRSYSVVDTPNSKEITIKEKATSSLTKTFQFDKVFGIKSKQLEVYKSVVEPLISQVPRKQILPTVVSLNYLAVTCKMFCCR